MNAPFSIPGLELVPEAVRAAFEGKQHLTAAEILPLLGIDAKTMRVKARSRELPFVQKGRGERRPRLFSLAHIAQYYRIKVEKAARRVRKKPQLVYFIRAGERVKIGIAIDPLRRLAELQTAHADPLELLLTLPGGRDHEQTLHRRFWMSRIGCEWFKFSSCIQRFIEGHRDHSQG